MSEFDQAIQEHIYLYKEGIQDKYYQGAKWAWQHQQAIIDNLKTQFNNMEACYIEKKKQVDEALTEIDYYWKTGATDCIESAEEALRGTND